MRLAYGKFGTVASLDRSESSPISGDAEVINLFNWLVDQGHEIHTITRMRNVPAGVVDEYAPGGMYAELPRLKDADREAICLGERTPTVDKFLEVADGAQAEFDAWIIWLGEHNGPCWPYPKQSNPAELVRPYSSRLNLCYPLVSLLNRQNVWPTWLCPDPRNILRSNNYDVQPTSPVIAQYNQKHSRFTYDYCGLELQAIAHIPEPTGDPDPDRRPFGAIINEGAKFEHRLARKYLIGPWLLSIGGELIGKWRRESLPTLPLPETVQPSEIINTHRRWRSTITLPANASGWATAKPWEAFLADTVCFAHPAYDDQNHIYGQFVPEVRRFLRPADEHQLARRVRAVAGDAVLYREIVDAQREVLRTARKTWDNGFREVLRDHNPGGR